MKQNERILVYLVTGFLAVILVVAVFFGHDTKAATTTRTGDTPPRGLGELIDPKASPEDDGIGANGSGEAVAPNARQGTTPPPLVASPPPSAAELVRQYIGESERDRTVRKVRARPGDSLDSIVRRWCGARSPHLEVTRALNENLVVVHPDQLVTVPWVDDEEVLAAYEARQPILLAPETGGLVGDDATPPSSEPTFRVPGSGAAAGTGPAADAPAPPAAGTKVHVVRPGESYWKIAADLYGPGKADRMIKVIRELNPAATDVIKVDQKLIVPLSVQ